MKSLSKLITLTAMLISSNALAGSFLLEEYNLVTISDVNAGNLHVDGRAIIGGDLDVQNNIVLGQNIRDGLSAQVAGQVSAGGGINGGNGSTILVSDSIDENGASINAINQINANQTTVNGRLVNNASVQAGDLSNLTETVAENLTSASNAFLALESNSEFVNGNNNQITGISIGEGLGADDYAVLDLDLDSNERNSIFTTNQNQNLEILANITNSVAGIIINVAGTNISSLNFVGTQASNTTNVLFNFYEATEITLQRQFFGSILAPLATLTASNNIEGSVGVLSLGSSHSGEIHDFITTVTPPTGEPNTPDTPVTEVPEPSTWLFFIAIALVTYQLRNRKNA